MPSAVRKESRARRAAAAGLPVIDSLLKWECKLCGRVVSRTNGGVQSHKRLGCSVRRERRQALAAATVQVVAEDTSHPARALSPTSTDGAGSSVDMDTDEGSLLEEESDSPDAGTGDDMSTSIYLIRRLTIDPYVRQVLV